MTEAPSPPPRRPARFTRWSVSSLPPASSLTSNRQLFRIIGIPALAFAGVLIYRGVAERLTLPACDSSRAKSTLSDVLKELKAGPLGDEPITTVSSSKDQVVCKVALALSGGDTLDVDYTFFWQGSTAEMKYAIARKPGVHAPAS